jgi:hypothetical protein
MLTTDSIDPSVKDFFPLIDLYHRSQNPDQNCIGHKRPRAVGLPGGAEEIIE